MAKQKILIFSLLIIILIIAGFFRLYKLNSIPPGLYPDVAINGNDVLDSLKTNDFKIFYPENNGREGLFFWFIALSFLIFGANVFAIKIVAAIFGILTVLGTYLLTKELFKIGHWSLGFGVFKNEVIALLASFFLSISFWHVNFSRIGFRAILVPFALVYGFYFLYKGFNSKKFYNFLLSGFFFAFGFYTYISYRFMVFILAISLFCWLLVYKKENNQKRFFKFAFCVLLFTFIFALPIGVYFALHPQDFFGRAAGVSVLSQPNPVFVFLKSLVVHFGMFNFYGDANWRHNFSTSPHLIWPVGIFFLIGLILSITKFIKSIKNKDNSGLAVYGLLLSWFFFMLFPSALSYEGIPHALRTIGVIPVAYIFAGLGAYWVFEKINIFYKTKTAKIIFNVIVVLFLTSLLFAEFNKYFIKWAGNPNVKDAFSTDLADIGNYLNSLPDNIDKFVVVNLSGVGVPYPDGIPMPAQTPIFIERAKYGKTRAVYIKTEDLENIKIKNNTIIIPLSYNQELMGKIINLFPNGVLEKEKGIWSYKLNFYPVK